MTGHTCFLRPNFLLIAFNLWIKIIFNDPLFDPPNSPVDYDEVMNGKKINRKSQAFTGLQSNASVVQRRRAATKQEKSKAARKGAETQRYRKEKQKVKTLFFQSKHNSMNAFLQNRNIEI